MARTGFNQSTRTSSGTVKSSDEKSAAARAGRERSREKTAASTGGEVGVIAKSSKPTPGPVLRSAKAAKDKGNSHDALRACRVLIGAGYRVGKDFTQIEPDLSAFGKGVPVDMAVGVSIDETGKATVKVTCRVEGREIVLGD